MAPLVVRDLHTSFDTPRGVVRAVAGVSLEVNRGETLGVVGESGSGKTVLCRSIMGLLPGSNVHRSGEVLLGGRDILKLSDQQLRGILGAEVAMVFQDPMTSLHPVMRVGRQITESLRLHRGMSKKEARAAAIDLLASVNIPEPARRFDQYPGELSGGLRQRVIIAIALACDPKVLLADEPTTALDVTVQAQILDLLELRQADRDTAMVLVSHDLGVVASRTDRLAVMYAGKVVETGPTASLFAETRMPYTEALLKSIPRLDSRESTRLDAIGGRPPSLIDLPAGCAFAPRCRYAQERCWVEEPPLRDAETAGHEFRCWFPVGTAAGEDALEQNLRDGTAAAAMTEAG